MRRFIFSFETWNVCGGKAYKKQQQQHRRKTLLWRKKNCDWWVRGLRIINIPNRLSVVVCVCIYILYCTHDRTSIHRTSQPEPTLRCGVSKQRNKIQTRINTNMDNLLYNVIRIPSNAYENLAQSVPFWLSGSLSLSFIFSLFLMSVLLLLFFPECVCVCVRWMYFGWVIIFQTAVALSHPGDNQQHSSQPNDFLIRFWSTFSRYYVVTHTSISLENQATTKESTPRPVCLCVRNTSISHF